MNGRVALCLWVAVALLVAAVASDAPSPVRAEEAARSDTLWIGNSLVRYHATGPHDAYDIPALVETLRRSARSAGRDVPAADRTRVLAGDGFGLGGWWNSWYGYTRADGERVSAARAIVQDPENGRRYDPRLGYTPLPSGSGGWDRIVLLSLANYLDPDEHWHRGREVAPYVRRWCAFIRAESPGAEILHYVAPADSRKIGRRQRRVEALYRELQQDCGGRLVPVGRAFLDAMSARRTLELRRPSQGDFVHYNDAGALLAASVFYAVLYGDPVGLPVPSGLEIAQSEARFLQTIAKTVVKTVTATEREGP